ncbi:MAG: HAD family phosphatase [Bacillota bacterium]|nr:HAD family phosphatase [Bacillota bacterium]
MINTVLFDMDGLLIDSEVLWAKVFQKMLVPFGKNIPLQHYVQCYSGRTIVENMEGLVEEYGLPYSTEEAVKRVLAFEDEEEANGVPLKPGAKVLIDYLKENQYKIVLATSSKRDRAINILTQNGIFSKFDGIACGDQVENGKPAPDIFLKAMEIVDADPKHTLVLEDSSSGILAARSANVRVICIPDLKAPTEEAKGICECLLTNLEEVVDFLKKENEA